MLLMLIPMLLAGLTAPTVALAQTETGPQLTLSVRDAQVSRGEPVTFDIENTGDTGFQGYLNLSVWPYEEGATDPRSKTTWYETGKRSIPAGDRISITWDQIDKFGDQAPSDIYASRVYVIPDGGDEQRTEIHRFEITNAPTPNPGPDVEVQLPLHDTTSPTRDVRIRFVAETADGLDRIVLKDNGSEIFTRSDFQDPTRYEHDRFHTLAPGHHVLSVTATDLEGDQSGAWTNVTVPRTAVATPSAGPLIVSTDRLAYEAGEGVKILIQNTGDEVFEGPPLFEIIGPDGQVVWHQQATGNEPIEPDGTHRFTWDQRTDDGQTVTAGNYEVQVDWSPAEASAPFAILPASGSFDLRLLAPEPGAGQQDEVTFSLFVGEPGATHVSLKIVNAQANFTREQTFPEPVTGPVNRTVDLSGAPEGTYRAIIDVQGPAGTGQATTWFRLLPSHDTDRPQLMVLEPTDGDQVPRLFPVVFSVEDDTGITYVEAYLDGDLVGRHSFSDPVQRGAFPVRVPADMAGGQDLRVVVYDTGKNQDAAALALTIGPEMPPCATVLAQAQAMATNTTPRTSGIPTPGATNASAEAGFSFPCPGEDAATGDRQERGDFRYARSSHGLADVQIRGHPIFESVTFEDGDRADLFAAMDMTTRGRFMVFEAEDRGNVTWDINDTWVAFQRGEHVVLENTQDGSRVLIVMHDATPSVLGQRLTADLGSDARVVVRPLTTGPVDDRQADSSVEGRVGAEVAIQGGGEPETVSYGDLQVVARQEESRVTATLSTEQHQGRTVVLTLAENATLGDELEVLLDGHPVEEADRLEDVLATPDPNQPSRYHVVQDEGQTKVIVQVNHFSTRELVVQTADIAEEFLGPIAIIGGLALIAVAGAGLFRRQEI